MKILLIAMPNVVPIINSLVECPNLGIVSLAGNLPRHEVRCLDLVSCLHPGKTVREILEQFRPQVVGLSAMTFQFHTLLQVAFLIKKLDHRIQTVAGGYHASLMFREVTEGNDLPLDFLVRGEGEETFRELADTVESGSLQYDSVPGLSFKSDNGTWIHNPDRGLALLENIRIPNRSARIRDNFRVLCKLPWDIMETSRGCTCACKFCSISKMYGKSFRKYPMARIEADWNGIAKSKKAVFIVDDNIGLDREHVLELFELLTFLNKQGPARMIFLQLSAQTIVRLADIMGTLKNAGLNTVFVGFETMDTNSLKNVSKPSNPSVNKEAAKILRANQITIIAGCIFGFPHDNAETIRESFGNIIDLRPDVIYPQYLTPYPGTELRAEMEASGLIDSNDFTRYDGYTCNIRTNHLSGTELRRALQKEILKSFFNPKLLWGNQLVRQHPSVVFPFLSNLSQLAVNIIRNRDFPRQQFDFQC